MSNLVALRPVNFGQVSRITQLARLARINMFGVGLRIDIAGNPPTTDEINAVLSSMLSARRLQRVIFFWALSAGLPVAIMQSTLIAVAWGCVVAAGLLVIIAGNDRLNQAEMACKEVDVSTQGRIALMGLLDDEIKVYCGKVRAQERGVTVAELIAMESHHAQV